MNKENKLKPRNIKQLKKSGYLEKVTPSIPKDEEILNIELNIDAYTRIMLYISIPLFIGMIEGFLTIFFNFTIWNYVRILAGTIFYIYYIFAFKRGYRIKILVFTNKAMYLFDNIVSRRVAEPKKYSDSEYVNFKGMSIHGRKKNFSVNLGVYFKLESNIDSLEFMYFLLNEHCNPKIQIKNRLKNQNVTDIEEEFQKIISKSTFKISNERSFDIFKKKESLLFRYISYEILTFFIMISLLVFVYDQLASTDDWYMIIMIDAFILLICVMILIVLAITVKDFKKSFKRMNFLPDSEFEICSDGIKAISNSGDVWFPFENNLIISKYDSLEKIFSPPFNTEINDGIELKRFNEKYRLYQLGPVEDLEYFYDILMYHYLIWLNQNDFIIKEEQIKKRFFHSDPIKGVIADKVMLKEETKIPNLSDISSFKINSEKAIFKYPKVSYNHHISDDEKIYHIHQRKTIPTYVGTRFVLSIIFIVLFGILTIIAVIYIQNEFPDEPDAYILLIFTLVPIFLPGTHAVESGGIIKLIKKQEVIFTESKIIFAQEGWLFPLLYEDITFVNLISEKKRYYKYLKFHSKNKANVTTLYGIYFDSPILKIINSMCKVKYSDY